MKTVHSNGRTLVILQGRGGRSTVRHPDHSKYNRARDKKAHQYKAGG